MDRYPHPDVKAVSPCLFEAGFTMAARCVMLAVAVMAAVMSVLAGIGPASAQTPVSAQTSTSEQTSVSVGEAVFEMSMIERGTVQELLAARRMQASHGPHGTQGAFASSGTNDAPEAGGDPAGTSPGIAFLSSAILPGSGQILNGRIGRGIAYAAIEAATLAIYADQTRKARDKERRYERFANSNWSVAKYAAWLVGYHDLHELPNPYLGQLRQITEGLQPAYDIKEDWPAIPIELLRSVERNTLYVYRLSRGQNTFSHVMPDYGSQQYYELISKYYQYGPGWRDFQADKFVLPWDGSEMSAQFYEGRDRAEAFNDHYRLASNMVSLLILNHVFSAFDAYFTVKLDASRLSALPPASADQAVRLRWAF